MEKKNLRGFQEEISKSQRHFVKKSLLLQNEPPTQIESYFLN